MRHPIRLAAIFLLLNACAFPAQADLKWAATEVETGGDAEKPAAEFTFTNTGKQAVRIISAVPGCECTRVRFDSEPVQPGEKGTIKAEFDPGQRSGDQKLDIAVWTDAGEETPSVLRWTVHLPDVLELTPPVLVWKEGETNQERSVDVRFPNAPKTRVLKVECDDPAFRVTTEGNRIDVTVKEIPMADFSVLRVTTDSKLKRLKEIQIPLAVGVASTGD